MANRTWEGSVSGDYSVAGNWVEGSVPVNADDVRIPATSTQAITSGLNQSAVTLTSFTVEDGAPAMGTETAYLQIGTGAFRFAGSGTSLIDLGSSAIVAYVDDTVTPAEGYAGLYLKGSAISQLILNGGHTALAWRMGETATATSIRINGSAAIYWGGSVTNTTFHANNGTAVIRHAVTTLNVVGGTIRTQGSAAVGTINVYGGICYPESSGTVTTLNMLGGTTSLLSSGIARTVTNWKLDPGAVMRHDPAYVTLSNCTVPSSAIVYTTSRPTTV